MSSSGQKSGRFAPYQWLVFPNLGIPPLWQTNHVCSIYPNCSCHPVELGDQGRTYSNLKLTCLAVLWRITSFVSDLRVSCLLPATWNWQANSLACKYSKIFTVIDNSRYCTFHSCYHCSLSLSPSVCWCVFWSISLEFINFINFLNDNFDFIDFLYFLVFFI